MIPRNTDLFGYNVSCNELKISSHTINRAIVHTDHELVVLMQQGNIPAFDEIYEKYWAKLYAYAYNRLREKEVCEEITQEVFISLWANRTTLHITTSLSGYLFQAVKYQMLNFMKSTQVRNSYIDSFNHFREHLFDDSTNEQMALTDLKMMLEKSISELPDKCQEVFRLSRIDHLSIKEIALQLDISHKTVENHLTKALKHLRGSLGDFLVMSIFFELFC